MKSNQNRSASLSLRQGIGILLIEIGLCWCLFTFIGMIESSDIFREYAGNQFHSTGFIIKNLIRIILISLIGFVWIIIGIWLLKDKKGMSIKF